MSEYFDQLAQTIIDGEKEECVRLVHEGLEKGLNPLEVIEKGIMKGIQKVGEDFGVGVIFLPELIMGADVVQAGVEILDEKIQAEGLTRKVLGRIVIGTVKGDIHDIGKSVVAAVLQANGYDVVDLGVDVDTEEFIKVALDKEAGCIALSSLLTLTIQEMGNVIESLDAKNLRDKIKVIVGGCPVTEEFANEIGADAVGFDAADAVRKMGVLFGNN